MLRPAIRLCFMRCVWARCSSSIRGDGPIYMALLVGGEALRRVVSNGGGRLRWPEDWRALVVLGLTLVLLAVVFFLPFLISFRSQLGGVLPNVIFPTRIMQFFMMFGPFILILLFFLAVEIWRGQEEMNWPLTGSVLGIALLALVLGSVVLSVIAWLRPEIRQVAYRIVESAGGLFAISGDVLRTRLVGIPVVLLTGGMIAVVIARLFARPIIDEDEAPYSLPTGFALLLVGAGAVLALFPDFFYLRDNFGTRMNTIFKFYYQVWLLWGVASAYAAYTILADVEWRQQPALSARIGFSVLLVVVMLAGLTYPVLGVYSRAFVEAGRVNGAGPALTLDGGPSLATADDYAVLRCLDDQVGTAQVSLLEAVGTSYRPDQGGRVSALTGIPTLLAWPGHESQWRGATYSTVAGTRQEDVSRIYNDPIWESVESMVADYGIDYIFVGSAEYRTFDSFGLAKFESSLTPVCRSNDTVVYRVD
jgi:hypothetical protein